MGMDIVSVFPEPQIERLLIDHHVSLVESIASDSGSAMIMVAVARS